MKSYRKIIPTCLLIFCVAFGCTAEPKAASSQLTADEDWIRAQLLGFREPSEADIEAVRAAWSAAVSKYPNIGELKNYEIQMAGTGEAGTVWFYKLNAVEPIPTIIANVRNGKVEGVVLTETIME